MSLNYVSTVGGQDQFLRAVNAAQSICMPKVRR